MVQQTDFRALFEASPYPYLLMSADSLTIVDANPAYLEAVGRTATDIVGKYLFDAFPVNPADPDSTNDEEVRNSIQRAITSRMPDSTPFLRYAVPRRNPARGFEERFWSTVHSPVLDENGSVTLVAQNAIDVTDLYRWDHPANGASAIRPKPSVELEGFSQARMHQAMTRILHGERGHLKSLFDQAPGFIAVLKGSNHVFDLANEAYYQLVGHRDIIGKPVWEALPELAGQGYEEMLDKVFRTRKPVVARGQTIAVQPEPGSPRSVRYVDLVFQPIFDSAGKVTAVFVQGNDVTEAHVSQQQLAEKVAQLEMAKARQALRLQFSDELRHASDSDDTFSKCSRFIGRHLGASRVLYSDYDGDGKRITFRSNYTDGVQHELAGSYPAAAFGASTFASLENGAAWVCDDVEHDPRTSAAGTWPTFRALGIHSAVLVPVGRKDRLLTCLFVNDSKPRHWTRDDVELIGDVAERTLGSRGKIARRAGAAAGGPAQGRVPGDARARAAQSARADQRGRGPAAAGAADAERVRGPARSSRVRSAHMTRAGGRPARRVARHQRPRRRGARARSDMRRVVSDAVEQARPLIEARGAPASRWTRRPDLLS